MNISVTGVHKNLVHGTFKFFEFHVLISKDLQHCKGSKGEIYLRLPKHHTFGMSQDQVCFLFTGSQIDSVFIMHHYHRWA